MSNPIPNPNPPLVPWVALNGPEGIRILRQLFADWETILADKLKNEEVYQQFIAQNAGLFFGQKSIVISKVRLGSDYVTDFVIASDTASHGFSYEFVELESPHTPAYTKKGNPSARLTTAIQQIQNWREWLNANRSEAKKLFPSRPFKLYDTPNFSFTIYIGRSDHLDHSLAKRNVYADKVGVTVHGFDHLTRILREPTIGVFPLVFSSEMDHLGPHVRNQLANPLTSAYSWDDWRQMVRDADFHDDHMIAKNWQSVLKYRKHSKYYGDFLALLDGLPADRKDFYVSVIRDWERF